MKDLTKEAILKASDSKIEKVDIPEWNGSVYVKLMSGKERDQFETDHTANPRTNVRARLAIYTVCDKDGKLLFDRSDINELSSKSSAALDRIFEASIKLNKLSKKEVEELEKK